MAAEEYCGRLKEGGSTDAIRGPVVSLADG
jgi:hypothetical protein